MTCTGCPALHYPLSGGRCVAGVQTAVNVSGGRRIRHPLTTCQRPRSDAELTQMIEIFDLERKNS